MNSTTAPSFTINPIVLSKQVQTHCATTAGLFTLERKQNSAGIKTLINMQDLLLIMPITQHWNNIPFRILLKPQKQKPTACPPAITISGRKLTLMMKHSAAYNPIQVIWPCYRKHIHEIPNIMRNRRPHSLPCMLPIHLSPIPQ